LYDFKITYYIYIANNYLQEKTKRRRRKVTEVTQEQEVVPQIGEFDGDSDDDDYEVYTKVRLNIRYRINFV
jgi:hypothetical protein